MTSVLGLWHQDGVSAVAALETLLGRDFHGYRSNQHFFQLWPGGVAIQANDAGIRTYARQTYWENDAGALAWDDVIAGVYDSVIDQAVQNIVSAGRWSKTYPYILVNGAEMDVNTPQQPRDPRNGSWNYAAMYAHVAARVEALGARVTQGGPVSLSWAPRAQQWLMAETDPESAYAYAPAPGDYDLVGAHAYLKWSGTTKHPTWQDRSLRQVVDNVHAFALDAGKLAAVFESGIAAPESPLATDEDRAALISDYFAAAASYGNGPGSYRFVGWSNRSEAGGGDYLIEHMGPASFAAFRSSVGASFYQRLSMRA